MEELMDGRTVWYCPNCGQENYDYRDTYFPLCSACDLSLDWIDIEDEFDRIARKVKP